VRSKERCAPKLATLSGSVRASTAPPAGGFFFPVDLELGLRAESYSPWILERLEWAGGNLESFQKGSDAVERFLGLHITAKGLSKITERLGRERASLRDEVVSKFQAGQLAPQYPQAPSVVAAMLDGGRAQVRSSNAPPGVHEPAWVETKVGNLATYTDVSSSTDPQPEPPRQFLDPPKVLKLVREMKGAAIRSAPDSGEVSAGGKSEPAQHRDSARPAAPKRMVRTVVATTKNSEEFGAMVAAEAARRGFYEARKKAALGDGSLWIWTIVALHFPGFVPILDFVHLIVHLHAAAQAAFRDDPKKAWCFYVRLIKLAWAGKAGEVRSLLEQHSQRLGQPPKGARDDDPRKVLSSAVAYVEKKDDKTDYPRYRMAGLPTSSAPIESLIKEVNLRVKGTDKFWTREGLDAVLQVRAAYLSEDGTEQIFWSRRPPGRAAGRGLFRRAA
jgi:hypothetical protein